MGTQANKELEPELYKLSYGSYDGAKIRIQEYGIVNETAKNYMCLPLEVERYRWSKREKDAFPKEHEGKVQFDQFNGNLHRASLFMTEATREDVESYGVGLLTDAVRKWHQKRADFHSRKVKELENPTIE